MTQRSYSTTGQRGFNRRHPKRFDQIERDSLEAAKDPSHIPRWSLAAHLPAKKQIELARRWRDHGDTKARWLLVTTNAKLAMKAALNACRAWGENEDVVPDLFHEALLGLLRATEKFDPDSGYLFTTYAMYWARQYAGRWIEENTRTVRVPLKVWWDPVARKKIPKEFDMRVIEDKVRDDPTPAGLLMADLIPLIDQLDERAALTIRLRYGIDGYLPHSLEEAATHLGCDRLEVRRIESGALLELMNAAEASA